MNTRTLIRAFASGEVSTEMFGRVEDARYQSAVAKLRNMIAKPQGPARRRPGLRFVREVKDSTQRARLFPFTYSADQTMVVEVGAGWTRFHTQGATLLYDTPAEYRPTVEITGVSGSTLTTTPAHGHSFGDPVVITKDTPGAAMPAPLVAGVTYYAIPLTPTTLQLAATPGGAAITLTTVPIGGSRRLHYAYQIGSLARWTGVPFNAYAKQLPHALHAGAPPTNTDYWHVLPSDPNVYEIPQGFTEDQLFELTYVQSADVMTFAGRDGPAYELRRLGATQWVWTRVPFVAPIAAPTGLAVTPTRGQAIRIAEWMAGSPTLVAFTVHALQAGDQVYVENLRNTLNQLIIPDGFYRVNQGTGSGGDLNRFSLATKADGNSFANGTLANFDPASGGRIYAAFFTSLWSQSYKVTAIDKDGLESEPTAAVPVTNNLSVTGAWNTLSWTAVTGAVRYRVYRELDGLFGFIGETESTSFRDDNIEPELGQTPPIFDTALSGTDYPGAVGYFQGRRIFAGTTLLPQSFWMTRAGTESDLSYHLPVLDDDRISYRLTSREVSTIRHIVPIDQLLLLTSGGEFRVTPINSDVLRPGAVDARPQSYVGASYVTPLVVNNNVVFVANRGGHVRELGFAAASASYIAGDLSLRAAHLFDGLTIADAAHQKSPLPILWFVSSSGKLLGLTYAPEEQIGGWHQHDTDGVFESVCCVAEGQEDAVYVIVRRTIDGVQRRYVERMDPQADTAIADAFFVDAGVTYAGAVTSLLTNLSHLDGKTVQIIANGVVQPQQIVRAGSVRVPAGTTKAQIGLPFVSELQTLPMLLAVQDAGQTVRKNVTAARVRVQASGPFKVGTIPAQLATIGDATLQTGAFDVTLPGSWTDDGQILVRQDAPLPLTVVSFALEVAVGG